jgi:hypothetical protein
MLFKFWFCVELVDESQIQISDNPNNFFMMAVTLTAWVCSGELLANMWTATLYLHVLWMLSDPVKLLVLFVVSCSILRVILLWRGKMCWFRNRPKSWYQRYNMRETFSYAIQVLILRGVGGWVPNSDFRQSEQLFHDGSNTYCLGLLWWASGQYVDCYVVFTCPVNAQWSCEIVGFVCGFV